MSFYQMIEQYNGFNFEKFFHQVTEEAIERSLARQKTGIIDFLNLLSPKAAMYLERMAQKAHQLTVQHFGRTMQLFIPLYISNHCSNQCAYCGFNHNNPISRNKLTLAEIEQEARAIARTGMQHVLFLTGEAQHLTPMDYLMEATACLTRYFASVSIEIYPLDVSDYRLLQQSGADGMTLFQETYNQEVYRRVHLAGKKMNYRYRLDAPERAALAGLRLVNIGPLLGLAEPRSVIFYAGLHAQYLDDAYPETEIAISLPRFNKAEGSFQPDYRVDDKTYVQFITALRIFLPRAGITISTRESAAFRDQIMPLGATRYSAGSRVGVGGYAENNPDHAPQFEITDDRSVDEVAAAIVAHGYQPVFKDWDRIG